MVVKGKFPTFDEASVREFKVLDFPALGLPTRPIRGSLGITKTSSGCQVVYIPTETGVLD